MLVNQTPVKKNVVAKFLLERTTANNLEENKAYLFALSAFKKHLTQSDMAIVFNRIQEGINRNVTEYNKIYDLFFDTVRKEEIPELPPDFRNISVEEELLLSISEYKTPIDESFPKKVAELIEKIDSDKEHTRHTNLQKYKEDLDAIGYKKYVPWKQPCKFKFGEIVGCQNKGGWLMAKINNIQWIGNQWVYHLTFCNCPRTMDLVVVGEKIEKYKRYKHRMHFNPAYESRNFTKGHFVSYGARLAEILQVFASDKSETKIYRLKYTNERQHFYAFHEELDLFNPLRHSV
jgi:hypothetical protein